MSRVSEIRSQLESIVGVEEATRIHERTEQRLDAAIRNGTKGEAMVIGVGYAQVYENAVMYEAEVYLQRRQAEQ